MARNKTLLQTVVKRFGVDLRERHPEHFFHSDYYLDYTARCLEHLASLGLPLAGRRVLEIGAGIGDHTGYYIARGCKVTITDIRPRNLDYLRRRHAGADIRALNMEQPPTLADAPFDVVHCYGVLYHLSDPGAAIDWLARSTGGVLLLESRVSFGSEPAVHPTAEKQSKPTEAFSGLGSRPTRPFVDARLRQHFPHVYVPRTQPRHEDFPLDWRDPARHPHHVSRAVFVAARAPLDLPTLADHLLDEQQPQV